MTAHASCTHPNTKADRARCRTGKGPALTTTPTTPAKPSQSRTRRPARTAAPLPADVEAARKRGGECGCGRSAGWINRRTLEPVCVKHVGDWSDLVTICL